MITDVNIDMTYIFVYSTLSKATLCALRYRSADGMVIMKKKKKQGVNSLDPLLVVSLARLKARKQVESTAQHFHSEEGKLQRINSSAQFKTVSMRSEKPICAPPRLS